jgi:hypothetical protein
MLASLKDRRINLTKALEAVSKFRAGEFDSALDSFVKLNINPAKVISLYPESISGRLSVPRDQWTQMFGGPTPTAPPEVAVSSSSDSSEHGGAVEETTPLGQLAASATKVGKLKSTLDAFRSSAFKDPETTSIASKKDKPRLGPHIVLLIMRHSSKFRR